jgi:hypothetical protein
MRRKAGIHSRRRDVGGCFAAQAASTGRPWVQAMSRVSPQRETMRFKHAGTERCARHESIFLGAHFGRGLGKGGKLSEDI